jgi:uncharacterized membrane protein YphA (DoxX/SURF4 family)
VPALDPILTLTANYCVALLFLFACYGKVRSFSVFRATLADYELVPGALVGLSAIFIVVLELAIGLGALYRSFAASAMVAAAVLLLLYAASRDTATAERMVDLTQHRTRSACDCWRRPNYPTFTPLGGLRTRRDGVIGRSCAVCGDKPIDGKCAAA